MAETKVLIFTKTSLRRKKMRMDLMSAKMLIKEKMKEEYHHQKIRMKVVVIPMNQLHKIRLKLSKTELCQSYPRIKASRTNLERSKDII